MATKILGSCCCRNFHLGGCLTLALHSRRLHTQFDRLAEARGNEIGPCSFATSPQGKLSVASIRGGVTNHDVTMLPNCE